jgi:hypothetical protein
MRLLPLAALRHDREQLGKQIYLNLNSEVPPTDDKKIIAVVLVVAKTFPTFFEKDPKHNMRRSLLIYIK